jgi:hypothetical protein
MEKVDARVPLTPMILGIVGGILLVVGSLLNWATVSVDFERIAAALGIDPGQIPPEIRSLGTASVTGWDIGKGQWTLVTGIVILTASALLTIASSARVVAFVMIFGGAVGGSMALYEATVGKGNRMDEVAAIFAGVQLPGVLREYFPISIGIGIWMCVAGGALAIVGGAMAMVRRGSRLAASAVASAGSVPPPPPVADGGFGAAWVGGSLPPADASPAADPEPEGPPVAPPVEPGAGSGTGVPGGGDDPPPSS